jgi:DegV family protein with EDD domain
MPKIALVTDSTAYIPPDIVDKFQITVVPLMLIWGEETFQDGVDITPQEFYARLGKSSTNPSTSQATIAAFNDVYTRLVDQDYEVLTILISSLLSGTVDSALQARDMVGRGSIEIVDSTTTSMALGLQVIMAARAIEEGATLADCKELAEKSSKNVGVIFTVDTLEFLHRGGRIGGGSRFLGTALNIKPILEVVDGRVEAVERVRTRKKSFLRMIEILEERIAGRQPVRLAAVHATDLNSAEQLLAMAAEKFNPVETYTCEFSPVIGTHTGPGTVGLCYMAGI